MNKLKIIHDKTIYNQLIILNIKNSYQLSILLKNLESNYSYVYTQIITEQVYGDVRICKTKDSPERDGEREILDLRASRRER